MSGNSTKVMKPTKISATKAVDVCCGEEHSAMIDFEGQVHTWGYGIDG